MTYIIEKRKLMVSEKLKRVKPGSGRYARTLKRARLTEQDLKTPKNEKILVKKESIKKEKK